MRTNAIYELHIEVQIELRAMIVTRFIPYNFRVPPKFVKRFEWIIETEYSSKILQSKVSLKELKI